MLKFVTQNQHMSRYFSLLALATLFTLSGCRECTTISRAEIPEQYLRLVNASGDNLWFGPTAQYDPQEAVFTHERLGELQAEVNEGSQSIVLEFPATNDRAERIDLQLDSVSSHRIDYNTLLITNKQCEEEYSLSYVRFNGEQMCGSCGDTRHNNDRYIRLEL